MPGHQQILRAGSKDVKKQVLDLLSVDGKLSDADYELYKEKVSKYNKYPIHFNNIPRTIEYIKETNANGMTVGQIIAHVEDNHGDHQRIAQIAFQSDGGTSDERGGRIDFDVKADDDTSIGTRMTIKEDGKIGIGTTAPSATLDVSASSGGSLTISRYEASDGITSGERLGILYFSGSENQGAAVGEGAAIEAKSTDAWAVGSHEGTSLHFHTTANDTHGWAERMVIQQSGYVGIGFNDPSAQLHVKQTAVDEVLYIECNSTSYDSQNMEDRSMAGEDDTAGASFFIYRDSNDNKAKITGTGVVSGDSSFVTSTSDYAEYFETADGKSIAVGTSVIMENGKIRAAKDGETPFGIIRPVGTSSVVGNSPWSYWNKKYKTDDYGVRLRESYTHVEWTDSSTGEFHSYHSDKVPSGISVPGDAVRKNKTRSVLNPDYDSSKKYNDRESRDEWQIVGLLGQVQITKGQPVASSWIRMGAVSSTVEMYYIFPCPQVIK